MKITELENRVNGIAILPLCDANDFPSLVWSSDGCGFIRRVGKEPSHTVAYMFTDGEIWAISTTFLHFYPELIVLEEERYVKSLERCAEHLRMTGIKEPYRWVAGMEGIEGRYLPSARGLMRGP